MNAGTNTRVTQFRSSPQGGVGGLTLRAQTRYRLGPDREYLITGGDGYMSKTVGGIGETGLLIVTSPA